MNAVTGDVRAQVATIIDFFEGGLSDHPADRGGLTHFGVTLTAFKRYRPLATADDLRRLTRDEAIDLLVEDYVLKTGLSRIANESVRFAVIDYAINSGPKTAIAAAQRAVGVLADGLFGPETEAAVNRFDPAALLRFVIAGRLRHLGRLITKDPRQAVFAAGLMNRVATILEAA